MVVDIFRRTHHSLDELLARNVAWSAADDDFPRKLWISKCLLPPSKLKAHLVQATFTGSICGKSIYPWSIFSDFILGTTLPLMYESRLVSCYSQAGQSGEFLGR